MPHRDQLESMRARMESLERQLDDGEVDQARERARLERELAEARLELAKERERVLAADDGEHDDGEYDDGEYEDEYEDEPASASEHQPSRPGGPGKGSRWFLLIPVLVGGVVAAGYFASRPSFEGEVTATGGDSWTFTPTRCLSGDGQRPEFEGALLENASGIGVRVESNSVQIIRRNHDTVTLTREQCSVFHSVVQWGDAGR